MTLEMCTLYKGVPHGIALIIYTDPKSDWDYFRGLGVFHHGQLHNAPFSCIFNRDAPLSFSKMLNGRPADASYCTKFSPYWDHSLLDPMDCELRVQGV